MTTTLLFQLTAMTTANVLLPSFEVRHEPIKPVWVEIEHVARCEPVGLIRWNPVNGWWRTEAGLTVGPVELSVGHVSEHGINRKDQLQETFDYVKSQYVLKF